MALITNIQTQERLTQLFFEVFINTQDDVTKVAPNSVMGGIGAGIAKIGQKSMKEIGVVETHLFPNDAYGSSLENIADNRGIAPRFGSLASSTQLRLVGSIGTVYPAALTFTGNNGYTFELTEEVTIGDHGFAFGKVNCTDVGEETNVDPLSINKISGTIPAGHIYVVNEFKATGGRDEESDRELRKRIKDGANFAARGTIAYITQVFMAINPNVLRVTFGGHTDVGKTILYIQTVNGGQLTVGELDTILANAEQYFNFADLRAFDQSEFGVEVRNIEYFNLDISMRVKLNVGADPDKVRIDLQNRMAKVLDPRLWNMLTRIVERDDLLVVAKSVSNIDYLADQHFLLNGSIFDSQITPFKVPKIRTFQLLDLSGAIISDVSGILQPQFFPNEPDSAYALQVLAAI
jgi:hypothetical protein